jgi:class 3 adenylate cyclase
LKNRSALCGDRDPSNAKSVIFVVLAPLTARAGVALSAQMARCVEPTHADPVERLDFTVIGPAVNEVAGIETLCEPLRHRILVSAELAAAVGDSHRLEPLGRHQLRGASEPRAIYPLEV